MSSKRIIHSYAFDGDEVVIDGEQVGSLYPESDGRETVRSRQAEHVRRREALGDRTKLEATLAAYWSANRAGSHRHPAD
jgi:hypothetical protein